MQSHFQTLTILFVLASCLQLIKLPILFYKSVKFCYLRTNMFFFLFQGMPHTRQYCKMYVWIMHMCGELVWVQSVGHGSSNSECYNRIPLNMQIPSTFSRQSQARSATALCFYEHGLFLYYMEICLFSEFIFACWVQFTLSRQGKWIQCFLA